MSKLYETIVQLCAERGVNITELCRQSVASRGSLTDLKMGRKASLSAATISKIATYFGVSVDYLLSNEKEPATDSDGFRLEDDIDLTDRQNEFNALKGKEHIVQMKLVQYIRTYKKAKERMDVPRNKIICQYSTLQYFEKYIRFI